MLNCYHLLWKNGEMIDKLSVILYSYFIAFASEKGCVFA